MNKQQEKVSFIFTVLLGILSWGIIIFFGSLTHHILFVK